MSTRSLAHVVTLAALLLAGAGCSHLVILHDPLSPAEHNDLGLAYETHGQLDLARREYRHAVRIDRHYATAWLNLGNLDARQDHWKQAAKHYHRALRFASADPDALNNLAVALTRTRPARRDEAERLARRAVAIGGPRDSVYRATLDDVLAGR
jgi:Flp pilus assembly protein TadD